MPGTAMFEFLTTSPMSIQSPRRGTWLSYAGAALVVSIPAGVGHAFKRPPPG
jgi:hypothetical protein